MPTREQVLRLLESGLDYRAAGERLGVPAGQAYLIATGVPADGGDALTPEQKRQPGYLASARHLVGPPAENPTGKELVRRWLSARATADEPMQRAAARREAGRRSDEGSSDGPARAGPKGRPEGGGKAEGTRKGDRRKNAGHTGTGRDDSR